VNRVKTCKLENIKQLNDTILKLIHYRKPYILIISVESMKLGEIKEHISKYSDELGRVYSGIFGKRFLIENFKMHCGLEEEILFNTNEKRKQKLDWITKILSEKPIKELIESTRDYYRFIEEGKTPHYQANQYSDDIIKIIFSLKDKEPIVECSKIMELYSNYDAGFCVSYSLSSKADSFFMNHAEGRSFEEQKEKHRAKAIKDISELCDIYSLPIVKYTLTDIFGGKNKYEPESSSQMDLADLDTERIFYGLNEEESKEFEELRAMTRKNKTISDFRYLGSDGINSTINDIMNFDKESFQNKQNLIELTLKKILDKEMDNETIGYFYDLIGDMKKKGATINEIEQRIK